MIILIKNFFLNSHKAIDALSPENREEIKKTIRKESILKGSEHNGTGFLLAAVTLSLDVVFDHQRSSYLLCYYVSPLHIKLAFHVALHSPLLLNKLIPPSITQ